MLAAQKAMSANRQAVQNHEEEDEEKKRAAIDAEFDKVRLAVLEGRAGHSALSVHPRGSVAGYAER